MKYLILFILSLNLLAAPKYKLTLSTWEFPPYTYKSTETTGFFEKILNLVFEEMSVEVRYRRYPWRRGYTYTEMGQIQGSFPYAKNRKRAGEVYFSDEIVSNSFRFFVTRDRNPEVYKVKDLEELQDYIFGGNFGYFYEDDFKRADLTVKYKTNLDELFKLLLKKEVDLVPSDRFVANYALKNHFPSFQSNIVEIMPPIKTGGTHLIISKNWKHSRRFLRDFNRTLRKVKKSKAYIEIIKEYTH